MTPGLFSREGNHRCYFSVKAIAALLAKFLSREVGLFLSPRLGASGCGCGRLTETMARDSTRRGVRAGDSPCRLSPLCAKSGHRQQPSPGSDAAMACSRRLHRDDVTEGAELCRGKKVFDTGVLHQEVRNSE